MAPEESSFNGWGTELQRNYVTAKVTQWVNGEVGIWMHAAAFQSLFFPSSTVTLKRLLRYGDPRVFHRIRGIASLHFRKKELKKKNFFPMRGEQWLVATFDWWSSVSGVIFSPSFWISENCAILETVCTALGCSSRHRCLMSGHRAGRPGPSPAACFVLEHPPCLLCTSVFSSVNGVIRQMPRALVERLFRGYGSAGLSAVPSIWWIVFTWYLPLLLLYLPFLPASCLLPWSFNRFGFYFDVFQIQISWECSPNGEDLRELRKPPSQGLCWAHALPHPWSAFWSWGWSSLVMPRHPLQPPLCLVLALILVFF